jgi:hypothetical protein
MPIVNMPTSGLQRNTSREPTFVVADAEHHFDDGHRLRDAEDLALTQQRCRLGGVELVDHVVECRIDCCSEAVTIAPEVAQDEVADVREPGPKFRSARRGRAPRPPLPAPDPPAAPTAPVPAVSPAPIARWKIERTRARRHRTERTVTR